MARRSRLHQKFVYASRGLAYIIRRELSFRVELVVAVVGCVVGWFWHLSSLAWGLLVLTVAVVLAAEVLNTVLERLLDLVEPRLSPPVALLKDLLAAVVFLVALASLAVGLSLLWSILR